MNWNKVKYWLGMKCVVEMNGEFFVTKRQCFVLRAYQGIDDGYWWPSKKHAFDYAAYDTKEKAFAALDAFVAKPV